MLNNVLQQMGCLCIQCNLHNLHRHNLVMHYYSTKSDCKTLDADFSVLSGVMFKPTNEENRSKNVNVDIM